MPMSLYVHVREVLVQKRAETRYQKIIVQQWKAATGCMSARRGASPGWASTWHVMSCTWVDKNFFDIITAAYYLEGCLTVCREHGYAYDAVTDDDTVLVPEDMFLTTFIRDRKAAVAALPRHQPRSRGPPSFVSMFSPVTISDRCIAQPSATRQTPDIPPPQQRTCRSLAPHMTSMPPKDETMYASIELLWLYTHHGVADHRRSARRLAQAQCVWRTRREEEWAFARQLKGGDAFAPVLEGLRAHIDEVRGRGGEQGNKLPALADRPCVCSRQRLQREVAATVSFRLGEQTILVLFHLADCQEHVDWRWTDIVDEEWPLRCKGSLATFRDLATGGGFSYGGVLGAGKRRAHLVLLIGILVEIVPGAQDWHDFKPNRSKQFEARVSMVEVGDNEITRSSVFLRHMAGFKLPIAVAHGEGRAPFAKVYPLNPNGSPKGTTGVQTPDGRVLALMPHPEKVTTLRSNDWYLESMREGWGGSGPWFKLLQSAREWIS
ncbi:class I glutamine amidotransferase-like protein [Athelia psychrophila]|uniref:Class I glutamine amidotransferase-like protein n=1 Tax=Athelia psychrophila TaxID=1759441 RepID=A0A166KVH7_9AGAM|nr:class I glutamine amidotransferase-like protein [Fibularhizoctonia sp. CBS 109695]